jgi:hypothetical protein
MKRSQDNTQGQTALLRGDTSVDTPAKNSLCCAAAGITALPCSTTEALTPHDKLREAATPDATLIAMRRPPAQPAVGYTHAWAVIDPYNEVPMQCKGCGALGSRDHADTGPCPSPYKSRGELLSALAALEQDKARLWDDVQALQTDSDATNELLLETLLERDTLRAKLAEPTRSAAQPHDDDWPKLEKPAKVGNGRFQAGVSSRLVVEAAQRQYEYEIRPPFETARNERLADSIATMVMEYIEGGLRMNLDWRSGLARIIQLRIARLLPEKPETILKLGETS